MEGIKGRRRSVWPDGDVSFDYMYCTTCYYSTNIIILLLFVYERRPAWASLCRVHVKRFAPSERVSDRIVSGRGSFVEVDEWFKSAESNASNKIAIDISTFRMKYVITLRRIYDDIAYYILLLSNHYYLGDERRKWK